MNLSKKERKQRRDALVSHIKKEREAGNITRKDATLARVTIRMRPKQVDEILDDLCDDCAGELAAATANGETDWEEFFTQLAAFLQEVLPMLLTICAA